MTSNRMPGVIGVEQKTIHTERIRLKLPPIKPKTKTYNGRSGRKTASPIHAGEVSFEPLFNPPKNKLVLDPVKALEPYKKKLSHIEAQRILGVIDELKAKCELVVRLPTILADLSTYQSVLDPNLINLLQLHAEQMTLYKIAEQQLTDLSNNTSASGTASLLASKLQPSEKGKTNMAIRHQPISTNTESSSSAMSTAEDSIEVGILRLNQNKVELQFSIRSIIRALRGKDLAVQKLLTVMKPREGSYFLQCISELRDIILERLLISPTEQNDKLQFMARVAAQGKHNQLVIQQLEEELGKATAERDKELAAKNDIITTLQHNLRNIETATEDDIRRARTEAEKQVATDKRSSDARKQKLESELKQLVSMLQVTVSEDRGEEQMMRKKKWKVESEIENWVQRFDTDMCQKQDEYEKIDTIYQEEQKQLRELEHRFHELEVEYKAIMDLRQEEKERQEAAERLKEQQTRAAIMIQATWRALKVRTITKIRAKQRKKKSKKKKKKT